MDLPWSQSARARRDALHATFLVHAFGYAEPGDAEAVRAARGWAEAQALRGERALLPDDLVLFQPPS